MARDEFHFVHTLRVRYDEIDGQQIVYNARYLAYCGHRAGRVFPHRLSSCHRTISSISGVFDIATVHVELDYLPLVRTR